MATPLATSLLHFQPIRMFKNMVVFWDYLAWQLFWLLFKIYWAIFFPNHLVTLPEIDTHIGEEVEPPWANLSKRFKAVTYECS